MKKTILIALLLLVAGNVSAETDLALSPETFTVSLNAGSDTTINQSVTWNGEGKQAITVETNITAEDTNTNGIYLEPSEELILSEGETGQVSFDLRTNHTLIPDNFTITTKASTDIYTETKTDSSGSSDSSSGSGTVETVIKYRNKTKTITVPEGSLNKTEEDRIRNILDYLNKSDKTQDRIIDNLRGNLSSEQIENRKLSEKLSGYKMATTGLSAAVVGLLLSLVAVLKLRTGENGLIQDLAGAAEE